MSTLGDITEALDRSELDRLARDDSLTQHERTLYQQLLKSEADRDRWRELAMALREYRKEKVNLPHMQSGRVLDRISAAEDSLNLEDA